MTVDRARGARAEAQAELHRQIGAFIGAYRLAGGDPSATQRQVLAAFPQATSADYACGLGLANRAGRARPS